MPALGPVTIDLAHDIHGTLRRRQIPFKVQVHAHPNEKIVIQVFEVPEKSKEFIRERINKLIEHLTYANLHEIEITFN